jgi:hypothetical protein
MNWWATEGAWILFVGLAIGSCTFMSESGRGINKHGACLFNCTIINMDDTKNDK